MWEGRWKIERSLEPDRPCIVENTNMSIVCRHSRSRGYSHPPKQWSSAVGKFPCLLLWSYISDMGLLGDNILSDSRDILGDFDNEDDEKEARIDRLPR